jgi:hypothetical protein
MHRHISKLMRKTILLLIQLATGNQALYNLRGKTRGKPENPGAR